MTTPVFRRPPVLVMETGVNQVAGGARAGWVSGNPSGMADGASVNIVFDLGVEWDQYPVIGLCIQPVGATSFSAVSVTGGDSTTVNPARELTGGYTAGASFSALFNTLPTSSGGVTAQLRPMGRYVVVQVTNTAAGGAMGASKVTLAAYPA